MDKPEPIIDKTTTVKHSERIKLKAIPYKGGHRMQIEWAFNPDNSYHLDQVLKYESSEVKSAIDGFIKNVIESQLKSKMLGVDD